MRFGKIKNFRIIKNRIILKAKKLVGEGYFFILREKKFPPM